MHVKRPCRKKLNFDNENENSNGNNGGKQLNLQFSMENSTSSQINNSSDNNLINHNEYLPTNEEFETLLSLYSVVNENENIDILLDVNSSVTGDPLYMSIFRSFKNYILLLDLSLCDSQGQKRPFEDSLNKVVHNKRSDSSNDAIVDDILILKQKYIELESKIKKLEEHWMCM
ncbi:unnamed protein product [Rotaria sp. Silwood1]|nr:unnamed protein product [Rotaria sp. Silwood1]CAF4859409.1 unnamed protein product [Rotaria sp. Silwood1]